MNTRERAILTTTCFGHFLSHFNMLVFPAVLLPLADRLGMGMAQTLDLSFWMYLLFGVTALPWGLATDRWGAIPFLGLFYGGAGLCAIGAAYSIDNPAILTLWLAGIGLFTGIYHPAGLGWISKEIERVSLGMAYNGIFGNLGLAAAPLLAGLVNWLWGVKAVYIAVGGLNLVGLLLILFAPKADLKHLSKETKSRGNESMKGFVILLFAMMLGGMAYRGATVTLPAYFELKNGEMFAMISGFFGGSLSENLLATGVTSFIYIVGMLGQYTGGRMAERYELRWCYLIFHALTVPAALFMSAAANLPLVGVSIFYIFFLLGMQPIENTIVARFTPKRFHHAAFGTKFVLTFGIGALSVKMVKWIEEASVIDDVFIALSLISLTLVGVIGLLIRKTEPLEP